MKRVYLLLVACCLLAPLFAQQEMDVDKVKEKIAEYRELIRGPYSSINWFCDNGEMRDSKDPCPDGKGIQRARYRPDLLDWYKRYHFYPAQILAGTDEREFWDSNDDNARIKHYQIDHFLRRNDNGWILEKAQFYRGAFQAEDEQEWGRDFLIWLLSQKEEVADNFLLIRQAVQTLPHQEETPGTFQMRAISKVISDAYPRFMDLRVKIHGKPEARDLAAVRKFKQEHDENLSAKQKTQFDELIEVMDGYYSRNAFEELAELNKTLPEGSELRQKTAEYIRYFYQDSKDLALLSATSDLLRDIRDGVLELSRGSQRLTAMDMSLLLEDILFRNASLGSEISGLEAMDRICYLEQATYATGFLAPWEYLAYQQNQWSLPDSGSMRLGRLLFSTEQSRRLLEWATNSVRVVYGDEVAMFASVAPMANGFVDDVVRSSILLPLGEHIELLSAYAAQKANLKNEISVVSNPSTMRGLNPGYAKGILEVMERATEDLVIDAKKIYVFDHPPADLKPVAGIATVSEGNMVSHVQLLARNLGIPNAVLSADNLQDLQKLAGQEVFYAVSPKGTIILKPAKKMTDEEKSLFTAQERKEEKVTVPLDKMDLSTRRVINLRELDAEDSGRWCGPKAANLGQLKKLFPDNVVEGLVIPFGIFREHMDQKMPGKDISYWAFLQQGFARAEEARKSGQSEAQIEAGLLDHLAQLREAIAEIPFLPSFKQSFQDSFAQILGQPLGEVPVFLRSDTNMEDLKDFTGAGLNKTLFNVRDPQEIWQGIREVWLSPYTERSFKWRQRYLLNPENVYPSLLVIPGVNVDYSGVVITQNVTTGARNEVTAAFSRGVGGAVDGQRAETYTIFNQGTYALVSPAREPKYLYLPAEGGTARGSDAAQLPLLNDYNLKKIRELATFVDSNYPGSTGEITYDMEMGFKDDHLWLFQVRPFVENKAAAASLYLQSINPVFDPWEDIDLTASI